MTEVNINIKSITHKLAMNHKRNKLLVRFPHSYTTHKQKHCPVALTVLVDHIHIPPGLSIPSIPVFGGTNRLTTGTSARSSPPRPRTETVEGGFITMMLAG